MFQKLLDPLTPAQFVLVMLCLYFSCGVIVSALIGTDLFIKRVTAIPLGRWRYRPTTWCLGAVIIPFIALPVYLVHRAQIIAGAPKLIAAGDVQAVGPWLVHIGTLTLAVICFVAVPINRCGDPKMVAALERALLRSTTPPSAWARVTSSELIKQDALDQTALCRAVADYRTGSDAFKNEPIWFEVVQNNDWWAARVSADIQKHEVKYQFDKMIAGEK